MIGRNLTMVDAAPDDESVTPVDETALPDDDELLLRPPPPADANDARSELEVREGDTVATERRFPSQSAIWYRSI
jgi:hypothetical protein